MDKQRDTSNGPALCAEILDMFRLSLSMYIEPWSSKEMTAYIELLAETGLIQFCRFVLQRIQLVPDAP